MHRGHFILLIAILFVAFASVTLYIQYQYNLASNEQSALEESMEKATVSAASVLSSAAYGFTEQVLEETCTSFFTSLSAFMGTERELYSAEDLMTYVPVLAIITEDGVYLNILSLVEEGGSKLLIRRWTECIPYTYTTDTFIFRLSMDGSIQSFCMDTSEVLYTSYDEVISNSRLTSYYEGCPLFQSYSEYKQLLDATVSQCTEKSVKLALSDASYVLGEIGETISFTCPSFLNVIPEDSKTCFLAIYQGFPFSFLRVKVGSGVCRASYIRERSEQVYVVPCGKSGSYYSIAHLKGCTNLSMEDAIGPISPSQAISIYGTYGCPYCMHPYNGFAYPPN